MRKQVLPGNDGGNESGTRAATPSDNIVSKDDISGIKGKRTSVYDTGTGRDFKH